VLASHDHNRDLAVALEINGACRCHRDPA
jgi:hypothetical protein